MQKPRFSSLQLQLGLVLLSCLLLPTLLVSWLAYSQLLERIATEQVRVVGGVADTRHEQLVMVLQRARNRAEGFLRVLDERCGHQNPRADCLQQKMHAFISSEGALGSLLETPAQDRLKVGEFPLPDAALPSFEARQLAQFSPRQPGVERSYSIIATDSKTGLRLALSYPLRIIQPLFDAHPDLGDSGESFLADSEGFFITPARYPAAQGHSYPIAAFPMQRCLQSGSGETLDQDYRDVPVIHAFRFVPEIGGGCIMAHIDQAEAFAPLTRLRKPMLLALVLFTGFAIFLAWYFSRRIVRPITQLTTTALNIAAGRHEVCTVSSGSDEVATLATAFNAMTAQLARAQAGLEERVQERTESLLTSEARWKFALEGAGDGVWDWNLETGQITFSQRYFEMLGYPEGADWNSLEDWKSHVAPEEMQHAMTALEAYLDGNSPAYATEYRMRCNDGSWKWILARGKVVARAEDGRPRRMIGTHADITERKQILAALQESETRYRSIFENAYTCMASTDANRCLVDFNEAFRSLLGYEAKTLRGMNIEDLTHPDDREQEQAYFAEIHAGQRHHYRIEKRYRSCTGQNLWVDVSVAVIRDSQGQVQHFVAVVYDITQRRTAEDKLNLMAQVFTSSGEGIVITDAENAIVAVNDAFTRLTGYSAADVLGQNPRILSAGRTSQETYQEMWQALNTRGIWEGELWDRRKTGESYPKWTSISAVRNPEGRLTHYIGSFTDISARKASEEKILHLAHHDALTQLPNRLHLQQHLLQNITFAKRNAKRLAVMLIDLDHFKAINDTLGHQVGDLLLVEVARRLVTTVRESDFVARLGGDEFVVSITEIDSPDDAALVADKIAQVISAPYRIAGEELRTSPSIGICLYPDDAQEISDLLKNADVAMYHAKSRGRGNYQFFREEMNVMAARRMAMEAELRAALENRQFVLHYQPQLDLRSGSLTGVEALVRWQHPLRGMVSPLEFIPVAEEIGLIGALGDWILCEACRQLKAWQAEGLGHIRMSVNLSASQFQDAKLPERIRTILDQQGLNPEMLDLEVTESMSMQSPADAIAIMKALTEHGMSLSIDDFGTGYSSLAYLKLFPIRTLKIDRSFVMGIETDPNDAEICDVTVLLAHKLGLEVVAEGVETEAQQKFLLSIGCEKIQGYLISKPLPAEQARDFLLSKLAIPELGTVDLW